MEKFIFNTNLVFISISILVAFASIIGVISELCYKNFMNAWIWMIPLILSVLAAIYFWCIVSIFIEHDVV